MNIRKALAAAAVAAPLLLVARPMPAPIYMKYEGIKGGEATEAKVKLSQAALCDGSVRLEPGEYSLKIVSMGDGSVRASFFDKSGRKAGEANGIIAVLRQAPGGAAAGQDPANAKIQSNAVQKVAPTEHVAMTFGKLGIGPNSRSNVSVQGQKVNLQILSSDGTHGVLIGLLVPAVQKAREAASRPTN